MVEYFNLASAFVSATALIVGIYYLALSARVFSPIITVSFIISIASCVVFLLIVPQRSEGWDKLEIWPIQ